MSEKKGRTTVYNKITTPESLANVNKKNIELENDFADYLVSVNRSENTIKQYRAALKIFWIWNLENNGNKQFTDLTKREIARFQGHALNVWGWSPKRTRMVKSVLSSLSNYIESVLDDEYKDFRPIINKIESPPNDTVREKTVLSDDDTSRLLEYLDSKGEYMKACLVALALYSGRRKSELPRFKTKYFDESNLICDGALYKTPEKIQTKGRGSKGKMLNVYTLAKPFKPHLDKWVRYREQNGINSEWLFPKKVNGEWTDEPVETSLLNSMARTFSDVLGINFYWHSLRHKYTTSLAEQGIPDDIIKEIVGWESIEMVSVYKDISAESSFEKYFGKDGIKTVKQTSLADL